MHSFSNYYSSELLTTKDEQILTEITLKQSSEKVYNERSSTQILDFLGDIGGFKEALLLIMVTVGEYFSSKFFISKVAQDLYLAK